MKNEKFVLTKDHLKLIKEFYIGWGHGEYGAPCVNSKRPYGNSDVEEDIARILGWKFDEELGLNSTQQKNAENIHNETKEALQIVLCNLSFEEGVYVMEEEYDEKSWIKL